ncbi:transcription termination factor NusA [Spiroplasma endosymbiont of Crioceris asparagi]|uniref:transcription termination factor NusA n=1 Tax=Spiroplasma endosymbiont of Crioceris asparagi TaxID=3066286 RepID=UPI0030CC98BB
MIDTKELLEAIYEIAEEKKIDQELVVEAIKEGFQKAYEKHFDPEAITKVDIDKTNGIIKVFKELTVVKTIEDEWLDIKLEDAKKIYGSDVTIGDKVYEPVEYNESFSKLAALQVSQIIKQKIREGEKAKIFETFEGKKGTIVGGIVRDLTETSYLIDIDGTLISIWNKRIIPGEKIKLNQRLTVYIEDVLKDNKHSQIQATRIHPKFLEKLLEIEVPEINEGVIEVKSVSREPGIRAKVAVVSHDPNVDPIGSCVGNGGSRIKLITNELNGEKIDVVFWDENQVKFIINALSPVKVISIDYDAEKNEAKVIVPDEQLSLAIGKKGMAARLVANLVKTRINIFSLSDSARQDIPNLWNGNITKEDLESKTFLNKRR